MKTIKIMKEVKIYDYKELSQESKQRAEDLILKSYFNAYDWTFSLKRKEYIWLKKDIDNAWKNFVDYISSSNSFVSSGLTFGIIEFDSTKKIFKEYIQKYAPESFEKDINKHAYLENGSIYCQNSLK